MSTWPVLLLGLCFIVQVPRAFEEVFKSKPDPWRNIPKYAAWHDLAWWAKALGLFCIVGPIVAIGTMLEESVVAGIGGALIWGAWLILADRISR